MENPNVCLEARIRLDFTVIQLGGPTPVPWPMIQSSVWMGLWHMSDDVMVDVPKSDVKIFPFKQTMRRLVHQADADHDRDAERRRVVGIGKVYFRKLDFLWELANLKQMPLSRVRQYLVDNLSTELTIRGSGRYELQATIPLCETPDDMMNLVAEPFSGPLVPLNNPYTLVVRGLPCQWFTADADSDSDSDCCKPSLIEFFQQRLPSAKISKRENDGDATYCDVVLQYENYCECYKAMKRLCPFSLVKIEKDGSMMRADYEIMWKDFM